MGKVTITIGEPLESVLARARQIDQDTAAGRPPREAVPRINFATQALHDRIMTDDRRRLLDHLSDHPQDDLATLADTPRRPAKEIERDLMALARHGLLDDEVTALDRPCRRWRD